MARSPRYRQSHDLWKRLTSTYKDKVFVGLKAEHEDFENRFGPIPFYPTTDYYQLCRVIAGAQIFIGNQSCPLHLALGMLKTVVVEECSHCNNCFWQRPNAYYFRDDKGELPARGQ
jgi:ADP-heptose:LPS heptosyltransferase